MRSILKSIDKIRQMVCMCVFKAQYGNRVEIGKHFSFRRGLSIRVKKTGKLKIGDDVFINNGGSLNSMNCITIGNNTIFGENVKIYDHNHKFSDKTKLISEQGYDIKPILIGENCWVGSNVIILPGVIIGSNCVIGAGCIIHHNIPDNTIVRNNQQLVLEEKRDKR